MTHVYLRDLQFLLSHYQTVAVYVEGDDVPIYYGPWYKCNLMKYEIVDISCSGDSLSFLVKYPDE